MTSRHNYDREIDLRRLGLLLLAACDMSVGGYIQIRATRDEESNFRVLTRLAERRRNASATDSRSMEFERRSLLDAFDAAVEWLRQGQEDDHGSS